MIDDLLGSGLLDETVATGFVRRGHFVYESGDHGDTWLALDLLFADQRRLRRAAARLAKKLRPLAPDLVCGPLVGGALVGQWVAYELGVPFVYAEPRTATSLGVSGYAVPSELRSLLWDKRAVVVDDAINAGAATLAAVREIEALGGRVVAVAALIVRAPGTPEMLARRGLRAEYLVGLRWQTWPATDCPLCRSRVPVDDEP